jgi:peroxiredoxin
MDSQGFYMPLKPGDEAPDFELQNQDRQPVRLSSFRGTHNVVLAFHPLAWTPVCATQMINLEQSRDRFRALHTHVLGLSTDSTATKAAWAKSLGGISFDLLSDFYPHGAVAQMYGVMAPEGFADRAVFVVDRKGRIAYARIYRMAEQPELDDVIATLEDAEARRLESEG